MNFTPRQHLEIDNYIKFVDEILHKCDKGIEYCKICPNEFVCTELEKDDFGLNNSTISEVLTAIQYALTKVPGYLNLEKGMNSESISKATLMNRLSMKERFGKTAF